MLPPGTVLLGLGLCAYFAAQFAGESGGSFRAGALVVGLAPLIPIRCAELVVTLVAANGWATVGSVMVAPQAIAMGPLNAIWSNRPDWVEAVAVRAVPTGIAVVLYSVAALRAADCRRWTAWHFWLPPFCLLLAGITTWKWGPWWLQLVLTGR
jgi:hypothetical protein